MKIFTRMWPCSWSQLQRFYHQLDGKEDTFGLGNPYPQCCWLMFAILPVIGIIAMSKGHFVIGLIETFYIPFLYAMYVRMWNLYNDQQQMFDVLYADVKDKVSNKTMCQLTAMMDMRLNETLEKYS